MNSFFKPITKNQKDFSKTHRWISRKRHPFNDKRLNSTYGELQDQIQKEEKIIVNQISNDTSQAARFYRFYGNKKVTTEELIRMNTTISPDILKGKKVICISDSSSFSMKNKEGHVKDFENFGVLQDGKTPGFHGHASLALDASNGTVLGLSDLILWNRPCDKTNFTSKSKEEKESYKWHLGASNSHQVLTTATSVNYLFDREADNFDLFVYIKQHLKSEITVRLKQNRMIKFGKKTCHISECLDGLRAALVYKVQLRALDHHSSTDRKRKKRKAREAELELRFANVEVQAPKNRKTDEVLSMGVVEVREITSNLPAEEEPLHWKIWTSLHLKSASDALQVVEWYLLRWTIEQLFRTMKKKGFNLEATQLGSVDSILKQTAITFKAATQVMQLVHARDQQHACPIEIMFDEEEQKVLKKINESMEGNTKKLKNTFPSNKLSYAAWIIARLGGWKGYHSQKPPGPLTMKIGLNKFKIMMEGYQLFDSS